MGPESLEYRLRDLETEVRNGHIYEKLFSLLFGEDASFSLVNALSVYKATFSTRRTDDNTFVSLLWIFCAESDEEAAQKVRQKIEAVKEEGLVWVYNASAETQLGCMNLECMSLVRNVRDLSLYMWDYRLETHGEVMLVKS